MRAIRSRLTFANVTAAIALFVALSTGTAFALSIDSKDVDNNSIKSKDLKNGKGVKCEDVVPGEPICLPGGGGGDGVGLTNLTVRTNTANLHPGETVDANCGSGERATGGGVDAEAASTAERPIPAANGATPTGWQAQFTGTFDPASGVSVRVWVVCAS